MKKLAFSLILCLTTCVLFAGNKVKVTSGDLALVLKEKSTALLEFDYSATKVGDKTLDEYLKGRGDDFVRDWPEDKKKAAEYFVIKFNKKNKKGLQVSSNADAAKYKIVVHVKSLDMGNGGSSFVPFSGAKAGGVIIIGTIDVVDTAKDNVVCKLDIEEVKGVGHVSETIRLGLAYMELAAKICDSAK